jgi:hypothetical protein
MMAFIPRLISTLTAATLSANLIARIQTWFEGTPSARGNLEAILLGVLLGLLIASLTSLIKLVLGKFLASTRNEVMVAQSPWFIHEVDEHLSEGMFDSQNKSPEDRRRTYLLVDTHEIELHEEMV